MLLKDLTNWTCFFKGKKFKFVDDYIPIHSNGGALAFSKNFDAKISVILIEKALAKLYGSYENLRNAPAD